MNKKNIKSLVESKLFINSILFLIVVNGVVLGLETYGEINREYGNYFRYFNAFVLVIFTMEIIIKLIVYKKSFFKNGWNVFDFGIVVISCIPTGGGLVALRALRTLRLLRLISMSAGARRVVSALITIIPSVGSVIFLLFIIFYAGAIVTSKFFSKTFPEWFGDVGNSMYTLFQIMTLESWSMGIVRPLMEVYPYAWMFFVPFIFITSFVVVNLVIGIIVDAIAEIKDNETTAVSKNIKATELSMLTEIAKLKQNLVIIEKIIKEDKNKKENQ